MGSRGGCGCVGWVGVSFWDITLLEPADNDVLSFLVTLESVWKIGLLGVLSWKLP